MVKYIAIVIVLYRGPQNDDTCNSIVYKAASKIKKNICQQNVLKFKEFLNIHSQQ